MADTRFTSPVIFASTVSFLGAVTLSAAINAAGNNITGVGTLSGSTLQIDSISANASNVACVQTGGTLGTCTNQPTVTGDCNCT